MKFYTKYLKIKTKKKIEIINIKIIDVKKALGESKINEGFV